MNRQQRIYLDNAATSWPKPQAVYEAVDRYQRTSGVAAGRGVYHEAMEVERQVSDVRRQLAERWNVEDAKRIIFTANGTDSLNLALHGLLQPGDHVVTTEIEHNSVLRPLRQLQEHRNVQVTYVACDTEGVVDAEAIRQAIQPRTKLIAMIHASNVTGAIQPVQAVGKIAQQCEVLFLVDAAQSAGHLEIDVQRMGIHLLATPAHKGLLGPLGLGLLYVAEAVDLQLESIRQGGTGTESEQDRQPTSLPEKYESGNLNVPAIIGLAASVEFLSESGAGEIRKHQQHLTGCFLTGLEKIEGVTLYGPGKADLQVGVVSLNINGYDPQEVAAMLDTTYGIQVRAGFHCAPRMHQSLGTDKLGGTVRFSWGPLTEQTEVDAATQAITEIADSS